MKIKRGAKELKKLMVLIVLVFLFGTTVGCGNGVGQNSGVSEEVTESRGIVDDYSDKLTLFDKSIKVPTTLKELGEGYEFGDVAVEYINNDGHKSVHTIVYKGSDKVIYVDLIDTTKQEMNENSIIYSIISRASGEVFKLNGLHAGQDKEEVKKMLGEPSEKIIGDFGFEQWKYYNKNEKTNLEVLDIAINEGKISSMVITRYPEKYR